MAHCLLKGLAHFLWLFSIAKRFFVSVSVPVVMVEVCLVSKTIMLNQVNFH